MKFVNWHEADTIKARPACQAYKDTGIKYGFMYFLM